jgi:hypothetical protein
MIHKSVLGKTTVSYSVGCLYVSSSLQQQRYYLLAPVVRSSMKGSIAILPENVPTIHPPQLILSCRSVVM